MKISTRLFTVMTICYGIIAVLFIYCINHQMRRQALVEAESKASLLLSRNYATHTYFSQNLKPRLFAWTAPFHPPGCFEPTWMSSTYALRYIDEYFKRLTDAQYYYKDAAVNARTPDNEADDAEKAFLAELNADPKLYKKSGIRYFDGQPYLVVMQRGERMAETCLRCHSTPERAPKQMVQIYGPTRSFHRPLGEVASTVSIRIPLASAYAAANRFSLQLSALFILAFTVLFGSQIFFVKRWIFDPLTVIRNRFLSISENSTFLGQTVPLPQGQELQEMTAAFNAMSVKLAELYNSLEERVQQRTEELVRLNRQIQTSLQEKEVLLREIHHRVKNNLQIISSLLRLQTEVSGSDQGVQGALRECQDRIKTMAVLHEILYKTKDMARINLAQYLKTLTFNMIRAYGAESGRVQLKTALNDQIEAEVGIAVALGLIVNELLTNSLKYAFPAGQPGEIAISLDKRDNNDIDLTVSDNGVGLPEGLPVEESGTLGLRLVHLLTKQLGGTLALNRDHGAEFHLVFKISP
ncbi:MAG TPA: hypothetical protein DCY27_07430 [Desulfobacterales bacterium]|nr:hypothetical protein [Desulfobacterales bacterium]